MTHPRKVADDGHDAAAEAGLSYSAWLANTARKEFTIRAGLAAVGQFEQDHGAFTAEEISDADAWAATSDLDDLQSIASAAGHRIEIDQP